MSASGNSGSGNSSSGDGSSSSGGGNPASSDSNMGTLEIVDGIEIWRSPEGGFQSDHYKTVGSSSGGSSSEGDSSGDSSSDDWRTRKYTRPN
jgi:hypothetical protein